MMASILKKGDERRNGKSKFVLEKYIEAKMSRSEQMDLAVLFCGIILRY